MSNFENVQTVKLCYIEATIRHSSFILSIFFSACVAIVSYKSLLPQRDFNQRRFYLKSILFGPLVCIFMTVALPMMFPYDLINGDYGPLNCSIVPDPTNSFTEKLTFYMIFRGLPIIACAIITLRGYTRTIKEVSILPKEFVKEVGLSAGKLWWYPSVLICAFFPSLIDQIISIYKPDRPTWITALHVAVTHSIGFINAVLYGIFSKLYTSTNNLHLNNEEYSIRTISCLEDSESSITEELLRNRDD